MCTFLTLTLIPTPTNTNMSRETPLKLTGFHYFLSKFLFLFCHAFSFSAFFLFNSRGTSRKFDRVWSLVHGNYANVKAGQPSAVLRMGMCTRGGCKPQYLYRYIIWQTAKHITHISLLVAEDSTRVTIAFEMRFLLPDFMCVPDVCNYTQLLCMCLPHRSARFLVRVFSFEPH